MWDKFFKVFQKPSAEDYTQQRYEEARLELLRWEDHLRYAESQVAYHRNTVQALTQEVKDESVLSTRAKVQREVVQPVRIKTGTGGRGLVESVELAGQ